MPDPIQGATTGIPLGVTTTGQAGASQQATDASAAQAAVAPATDQADVGQTEALLSSIIQAANKAPATDDAKVDALQQSIANGSYQVDSLAIAKKLMNLDNGSGEDGQ
ncbi:MAG TPA: flagellar biosynthesis anti-sigma factor FlgM [Stellaceae bacterium]|jgi:flagellar biosynthesis anti-sigma factor FlgM|nr:flagellar biosynthesis anti-sigma factor FlgM [Stellaceae bacterium]